MRFDPSIAAQASFKHAQETEVLGEDLEPARDLEQTFSSNTGSEARAAYEALQGIGKRHLNVKAFQAFLIFITWQQATEETIPIHFHKGLELCDRYLSLWPDSGVETEHIRELRASFQAGLGLDEEEDDEFDKDTFKGGD